MKIIFKVFLTSSVFVKLVHSLSWWLGVSSQWHLVFHQLTKKIMVMFQDKDNYVNSVKITFSSQAHLNQAVMQNLGAALYVFESHLVHAV